MQCILTIFHYIYDKIIEALNDWREDLSSRDILHKKNFEAWYYAIRSGHDTKPRVVINGICIG